MLDKHLTVKTYGAADKDNIVFWHNYRVTVLDGRLFRIESNADKEWRDRATQSIWFRNAAKQSFETDETGGVFKIITPRICFENIYDGVAEVYCGGKRIDCGKEYFVNLTVTVNYEHGTEIRVVAKDRKTAFENMLYRMKKIMTEAEEDVFIKDKWYNEFIRAENACILEELIVSSELKEVTKTKLKEIFF